MSRQILNRILVVVTMALGINYIIWRWFFSLNFHDWWIAIPLVIAETYSLIDVALFCLTIWRTSTRPMPPHPEPGLSVDVFITTYNEPAELVRVTAKAARDISYPHETWILDDGSRSEMRDVADQLGIHYITRGDNWKNQPRHAKAGNLNNALMDTHGEFMLILDADQVPRREILDHTLGYFENPKVALVQTPQWFRNVDESDPLGSQAQLFYGPIMQGKDGWNAAFFCGSNAVLRREALMQLALSRYAKDVQDSVLKALKKADGVLSQIIRSQGGQNPLLRNTLTEVSKAITATRARIAAGGSIGDATFELHQRVGALTQELVRSDVQSMLTDFDAINETNVVSDVDHAILALSARQLSPLGALESLESLLRSLDVDRSNEAQPLMPLATHSVTEDMATSMRLHELGWHSVYHHEVLAVGLAPEDLKSMLTQRLRWAQGTMQVMFRENPLSQSGLTLGQRLMYFATMWSYLSGFVAIIYFAAPVIYLCFDILPVKTSALTYFLHFLPFMVANQLLFLGASRGLSTWRGQQYSLALFPTWIKAVTSAFANVFFDRPLSFAVTPKTKQATTGQWQLVKPQIFAAAILLLSGVVGLVRVANGIEDPTGTLVNIAWVFWNLSLLSILIRATRFHGFQREETLT